MKARDIGILRFNKGTTEWLIYKWTHKIWKTYPLFAHKRDELPSVLRKEMEQDIHLIIEYRIKELFPDRTLLK